MRTEGQNQIDEEKETNVIASDNGLYIWLLILILSSIKNLSTNGSLKKNSRLGI